MKLFKQIGSWTLDPTTCLEVDGVDCNSWMVWSCGLGVVNWGPKNADRGTGGNAGWGDLSWILEYEVDDEEEIEADGDGWGDLSWLVDPVVSGG